MGFLLDVISDGRARSRLNGDLASMDAPAATPLESQTMDSVSTDGMPGTAAGADAIGDDASRMVTETAPPAPAVPSASPSWQRPSFAPLRAPPPVAQPEAAPTSAPHYGETPDYAIAAATVEESGEDVTAAVASSPASDEAQVTPINRASIPPRSHAGLMGLPPDAPTLGERSDTTPRDQADHTILPDGGSRPPGIDAAIPALRGSAEERASLESHRVELDQEDASPWQEQQPGHAEVIAPAVGLVPPLARQALGSGHSIQRSAAHSTAAVSPSLMPRRPVATAVEAGEAAAGPAPRENLSSKKPPPQARPDTTPRDQADHTILPDGGSQSPGTDAAIPALRGSAEERATLESHRRVEVDRFAPRPPTGEDAPTWQEQPPGHAEVIAPAVGLVPPLARQAPGSGSSIQRSAVHAAAAVSPPLMGPTAGVSPPLTRPVAVAVEAGEAAAGESAAGPAPHETLSSKKPAPSAFQPRDLMVVSESDQMDDVPTRALPRPERSPWPQEPRVHIGQVDVIVMAPPAAPPARTPSAPAGSSSLASRLYLRNL